MKTVMLKEIPLVDRWIQRVATATLLALAAGLVVVGIALYA